MSKFVLGGNEPIGLLIDGHPVVKPDKVVTTLEEALEGVVIEWNN